MPPLRMETPWRERISLLANEIIGGAEAEIAAGRVAGAAEGSRAGKREAAEVLNQTVRRLRQAGDAEATLQVLVASGGQFAERTAGLTLDGTTVRVAAVYGFEAEGLTFDSKEAAALLTAIDTKDPVVAAGNEDEVSAALFEAGMRDFETAERAYFFPLVTGGSVAAVLFAAGGVQAAALELLTEAAALRLELLAARAPQVTAPVASASPKQWEELSAEEQARHIRAQRFARVKVAELRLANGEALRRGQQTANVYAALRTKIDPVREQYGAEFAGTAAGMVDYLHLELVRSLANDDEHLMGPAYPGRLF